MQLNPVQKTNLIGEKETLPSLPVIKTMRNKRGKDGTSQE